VKENKMHGLIDCKPVKLAWFHKVAATPLVNFRVIELDAKHSLVWKLGVYIRMTQNLL
jgi:hypothetical protein